MDYRKAKRWGEEISTVGIGGSYLPGMGQQEVDGLVGLAVENGINIIDLATDGPDTFAKIGKALKGRRSEMNLAFHLGLTFDKSGQYMRTRDMKLVKSGFEKQLASVGTDYADVAYIHYVDEQRDYDRVFSSGVFEYALELRNKGIIRKLGFASHRANIAKQFLDTDEMDLFLFSINPAYDIDPVANNPLDEDLGDQNKLAVIKERAELYKSAAEKGVGITVMKTFGSGRLLRASSSPFGRAMTVAQCMKYALDRPAVISCMIGVGSANELEGVLKYYGASSEELDYSFISGLKHEDMDGQCVYCNHCLPCPSGINIGSVHKFMDLYSTGDELAKHHYLALEHGASECSSCVSTP